MSPANSVCGLWWSSLSKIANSWLFMNSQIGFVKIQFHAKSFLYKWLAGSLNLFRLQSPWVTQNLLRRSWPAGNDCSLTLWTSAPLCPCASLTLHTSEFRVLPLICSCVRKLACKNRKKQNKTWVKWRKKEFMGYVNLEMGRGAHHGGSWSSRCKRSRAVAADGGEWSGGRPLNAAVSFTRGPFNFTPQSVGFHLWRCPLRFWHPCTSSTPNTLCVDNCFYY